MPIEADEGAMLVALVLQKGLALLHAELLQVSAIEGGEWRVKRGHFEHLFPAIYV